MARDASAHQLSPMPSHTSRTRGFRARVGVVRARWRSLRVVMALAAAPACAGGQAADADEWRTDFSRHVVPLSEIVSGGPPKDGIPAIDRPRFERVDRANRWLREREPVLAFEHGGVARAYPLQILVWHEIVNDEVAGLPVAVTFCPLCNTAMVLERRHRDRVLDFGVSGRLRHSDMVMYDRQTESWWQQATGQGLVGAFAGDTLRMLDAQVVSWGEFRRAFPRGEVLSRETGVERPYGRNPYTGYDAPGGSPIARFFRGRTDDRLPPMERVVAVHHDGETVAYPFSRLHDVQVVNDEVGSTPIVVFWAPGTASALDEAQIAEGRDVGATGVFARRLDGRTLTFGPRAAGRYRDRETGTEWNLLGQGISGPLSGRRLQRMPAGDYFWFAWAVFRPETRIWR